MSGKTPLPLAPVSPSPVPASDPSAEVVVAVEPPSSAVVAAEELPSPAAVAVEEWLALFGVCFVRLMS